MNIFGVKMSARIVREVGSLLIIAVQFYFLVHLRRATKITSNINDPGWVVPWIGIYPDMPSRVATALTTMVLPLGSIIFVAHKILNPKIINMGYLYLAICFVLSLATSFAWIKYWEQIDIVDMKIKAKKR